MNHVVLSGIIKYDPDIIYNIEKKTVSIRLILDVLNRERHVITLTGPLAEDAREQLAKNDWIELTGRVRPNRISYNIYNEETIEWTSLTKMK